MPHRFKQAAHLTIAALANRHAHPAVRAIAAAILNREKLRHTIFKLHAIKQLLTILRGELAQNAYRVFTLQSKARMHQAISQLTRIRKQQQAFSVQIQATDRQPFAEGQTR